MSKRKRSIFKKRKRINYPLILGVVLLSCVAVLLIAYAISAIISQKDEYYDKGVTYYESGSYQEAITSFKDALNENQLFSEKKDQNIKLYMADAYLKSAQYAEAAATYKELTDSSFSGSNVNDLKDLASALDDFSNGNYGGALDVLLKEADTYPELYMYIGMDLNVTIQYTEKNSCYFRLHITRKILILIRPTSLLHSWWRHILIMRMDRMNMNS